MVDRSAAARTLGGLLLSGLFGQLNAPDASDAAGWHFVRVAVERGIDLTPSARRKPTAPGSGSSPGPPTAVGPVDGAFTYRTRDPLPVGRRVEVGLGRGNVESAGIVVETGGVELAAGLSIDRIKPVLRDTGSGLPARLVELARWMAGYYVCPLGMVLSGMMPAAVKRGTGRRTRTLLKPADEPVIARLLEGANAPTRALWERVGKLDPAEFPIEPRVLADRLAVRTLGPINRLVRLGLLVAEQSEEIAEFGGPAVPGGGPSGPSLDLSERPSEVELTAQQRGVVEGITAGDGLDHFAVHLIRGITGSGKTEVYQRVMARVLESGRSALMLVPEISLTPQTAARFIERFSGRDGHGRPVDRIAVLHSGLTASQRHRQWQLAARGVRTGGASVVIGARSAVFAPLPDLGLIVVDEEHAGDYKQDQLPRYHARDVAIKRAHLENCPVILGSATPSLESWVNAVGIVPNRSGGSPAAKYRLWELTARVGGGTLPPVEVVDLAAERRLMKQAWPQRDPWQDVIGVRLATSLHETLESGGQAILLLNRRGYAGYIACPDVQCGYRLECDQCAALMVHHRVLSTPGERSTRVVPRRSVVRCHHCLAQVLLPERCPLCERRLTSLGSGTQRLEEELGAKFPELADPSAIGVHDEQPTGGAERFARVDADTTRSGREWFELLGRFARGELRVLLGTQMIAKGLDFPNVRLVGVINADTALAVPDFRAAERTFQLVSQVAGRAGRSAAGGRVIVQTMEPNAPAIRFAAAHDFVGFAEWELAIRRRVGYPPASRMARVVCRDVQHARAASAAAMLAAEFRAEILRRGWEPLVQVDGPHPAPVARIAGHHRFEVLLTARQRSAIQEVLGTARSRGLLTSDARTAVDVDPVSLM